MGRSLFEGASFGPETLKLLGQAFDEAWQEIAGNCGDAMAVDRRNRLALTILRVADTGERDVARLKDAALQAMERSERPLPFIRGTRCITILTALVLALLCAGSAEGAPMPKPKRVTMDYVLPIDPEHKPLYDLLREHRALEHVQTLLAAIRWPRTLKLEVKGCDGESNAWYEDGVVTVSYEYLVDMWRSANSSKRPDHIAREDAFVGPFIDVFLHEASHAMFDLLKVPVLGREEDAADQVAAYVVLQLPKEQKRRLILGNAYSYASELKVRSARDLTKRRFDVGRHITFADEHGTPAQRLYNLLCVAYGSDARLFADVVEKGYLPKERAEGCPDEYKQIDFAYRRLISPNVDTRR